MPKNDPKNELLLRAFADERTAGRIDDLVVIRAPADETGDDAWAVPDDEDTIRFTTDMAGCRKEDIEIEITGQGIRVRAWTEAGDLRDAATLVGAFDAASAEARFLDGRLEVCVTPRTALAPAPLRRIRAV